MFAGKLINIENVFFFTTYRLTGKFFLRQPLMLPALINQHKLPVVICQVACPGNDDV